MNAHQALETGSLRWVKSTYSNAGNNCVEVADTGTGYAVRDSKSPQSHLTFGTATWRAFVTDVKRNKHSF